MEPWILPEPIIIENAECALCTEGGLPHDAADQDAYCPEHQMAWETGVSLDDFTDTGEDTRADMLRFYLNTPPATDSGACDSLGCEHHGPTRIDQLGSYPYTMVACTECAVMEFLPASLLDMGSWVEMLADEILDP